MPVEIRVADENNASEWEKLVETSPCSTIFHRWEWLKTVEKHTKSRFYPIIGYENSIPIGIFPLFSQKKFSIKSLFSPPPATAIPYLGPLMVHREETTYDRESSYMEFSSKVLEFISSEIKPNYTRFNFSPGVNDLRPLMWAGYEISPYYCYYVDIKRGDSAHLLAQFKKRLRQGINRAVRFGVTVREGEDADIPKIYHLMQRRYSEQDKPVTVSEQYLREIYNKFSSNIKIWVAEYEGEVITGLIEAHYKNEIASWIGNPKPETKDVNANDLLNWFALKWACDNGFSRYITVGAAGVRRLYPYYSKFNFEPLLCLTAKRYSSSLFKLAESSYTNIIKPIQAKLKK